MSETKINAALVSAAQAALVPITASIAFEGKAFTPPSSGKWASVFRLPAGNDVASMGEGGQDEATGVFQIDISVPENTGTSVLLTDIDALKDAFVGGRYLEYQSHHTLIRKADPSPIRRVDGWLRISLSVYYTSRQQRGAL